MGLFDKKQRHLRFNSMCDDYKEALLLCSTKSVCLQTSLIRLLDQERPKESQAKVIQRDAKKKSQSKSKEKSLKRPIDLKGLQLSKSNKKTKSTSRSLSKKRTVVNKNPSKVGSKFKKEHQTFKSKPSEPCLKTKKSYRPTSFKNDGKYDCSKTIDHIQRKSEKRINLNYIPKQQQKIVKQKSKSERGLDKMAFSQISKDRKLGSQQVKVLNQYFGVEGQLSSIEELIDKNKFISGRIKLKKRTSKSSQSALGLSQDNKFQSRSKKSHESLKFRK